MDDYFRSKKVLLKFHYVNEYHIKDKNHYDYQQLYIKMVMHPNRDKSVEEYQRKEFFHWFVDEDK
jgi:hypothetical protein